MFVVGCPTANRTPIPDLTPMLYNGLRQYFITRNECIERQPPFAHRTGVVVLVSVGHSDAGR